MTFDYIKSSIKCEKVILSMKIIGKIIVWMFVIMSYILLAYLNNSYKYKFLYDVIIFNRELLSESLAGYLGLCFGVNAGLTLDVLRKAIQRPCEEIIQTKAKMRIQQLEEMKEEKINKQQIKDDVDNIIKTFTDQINVLAFSIRKCAFIWCIFCIIAIYLCHHSIIKKAGIINVWFLLPIFYFKFKLVYFNNRFKNSLHERLNGVDKLMDSKMMHEEAIKSLNDKKIN